MHLHQIWMDVRLLTFNRPGTACSWPRLRGGLAAFCRAAFREGICRFGVKRWGNRPALLWISEEFWVLRFRLMVKRGHRCQKSRGKLSGDLLRRLV
jgi:hypothetical protein